MRYNDVTVFFSILADIVVFVHLLWIVFLILGAIPGVRYPFLKIIHIAGLAFSVIIQLAGWYCPLTHLEIWLRMRHDPTVSYTGSFIIHYIEQIVYLDVSRSALFFITILLVVFNVCIYGRRKKN
jgi:hypothetical protein